MTLYGHAASLVVLYNSNIRVIPYWDAAVNKTQIITPTTLLNLTVPTPETGIQDICMKWALNEEKIYLTTYNPTNATHPFRFYTIRHY